MSASTAISEGSLTPLFISRSIPASFPLGKVTEAALMTTILHNWEASAQQAGIEVLEPRIMGVEEKRVRSLLATQKKLHRSANRRCERAEEAKIEAEAEVQRLRAASEAAETEVQRLSGITRDMERQKNEYEKTHISLVDLEETVACGICWDICWRPALLSCGHCFCDTCLRTHFETAYERALQDYFLSRPVYTCPTCRDAHVVTRKPETCFILKTLAEKIGSLRGRAAPPAPEVTEGRGFWSPFFV